VDRRDVRPGAASRGGVAAGGAGAVPRTRGRQKAPTKVPVSIRLDAAVVRHFKAGGPGWQRRINEILRKAAGL